MHPVSNYFFRRIVQNPLEYVSQRRITQNRVITFGLSLRLDSLANCLLFGDVLFRKHRGERPQAQERCLMGTLLLLGLVVIWVRCALDYPRNWIKCGLNPFRHSLPHIGCGHAVTFLPFAHDAAVRGVNDR